jgi:hypothetical protein
LGTTDRKNPGSIGPTRTGEKYFSQAVGVGFYAFVHDGKMTQKWDFRASRRQSPARIQTGTERGKIVRLLDRSR